MDGRIPTFLIEHTETKLLHTTTTRITKLSDTTTFEPDPQMADPMATYFSAGAQQVPANTNGTYILPNATYGKERWESDAQIAARKAMAKRSSRSYAARISRAKSRRKELLARPARPGITLDTSFTRHKGSTPHQVFPHDHDLRASGSVKKSPWFGLGRSTTGARGLGIRKGTPQLSRQVEDTAQPGATGSKTNVSDNVVGQPNSEPKTADSLRPGSKTWLEISPSDRPIPIGISVPSDSVPDFSPYQSTRERSGSDATLVTPSIIVTPAAAMKSVWSPDTESDYTPGRSSSIYSRATFNFHSTATDAPPVPALPPYIANPSAINSAADTSDTKATDLSHVRQGTLDSAVTAFEEDDDINRKDRIASSATYFEEDEMPLHDRVASSSLSIDTTVVPTPRRSRGWWNVITTPFEFTRANSVWTQNGRNVEKTPDVPVIPSRFDEYPGSPPTPSTYIWSATEKSPSVQGDSPLNPRLQVTTIVPTVERSDRFDNSNQRTTPEASTRSGTNESASAFGTTPKDKITTHQGQQTIPSIDRNVASPLSAMSASPTVETATIGTVLMPRQVAADPQTINVHIELQDRRPALAPQNAMATSWPNQPRDSDNPQAPWLVNVDLSSPGKHTLHNSPPQFDPPPTFARKASHFSYEHDTRASSPISTDLKGQKKHRKIKDFMACLPLEKLRKRSKNTKKQEKKKGRSRRWCCICCCCLIFLLLLAVLIPVTVVLTRKHNNGSRKANPPSQWLNLTGYPPMPTGISTIAQPEAVVEESGCIVPSTAWSCALPKEQQQAIAPNKPDQPNFKLQIVFQNGTVVDPSKTQPIRRAPNPVSAGSLVRSLFHQRRATLSASPSPPSDDDMKFLGNTTNGNSAPFDGEVTPFFFSLVNTSVTSTSQLNRRDNSGDNITSIIPPPALNPDGTAAPANLSPLVSNEPIRLFNRGQQNEHYGFYVYYDRSIFLKSISENFTHGGNPADVDGGSPFDAATLRCTWAQTRFLVQIWTNSQTTKPLLASSANASSTATFKRPGTFPYPVTITLDRHGGTASAKMAYCYDMENDGTIKNLDSKKTFLLEDRTFGGTLVNPSKGIGQNVAGPIDGGTGGCQCQWQNWLA